MIVQQELDGGGTKGSHLRWCVPLPLIIGVRLHAKLGVPSLTDPGLLLVEQPRNAIVLHPRQMPGQPGNRIGVMAGLTMNFIQCEASERPVQYTVNPVQGIEYYILGFHGPPPLTPQRYCCRNHPSISQALRGCKSSAQYGMSNRGTRASSLVV